MNPTQEQINFQDAVTAHVNRTRRHGAEHADTVVRSRRPATAEAIIEAANEEMETAPNKELAIALTNRQGTEQRRELLEALATGTKLATAYRRICNIIANAKTENDINSMMLELHAAGETLLANQKRITAARKAANDFLATDTNANMIYTPEAGRFR